MASRYSRYPEYDWRGIAMLTEQLGNMFAPNQLQVMDAKQKHEMSILSAKQAWKMETENLEYLRRKFDETKKSATAQEEKMRDLGLMHLAPASAQDGAIPEATMDVFEAVEGKKVNDVRRLADEYSDMIRNQEVKLGDYVSINEHGKYGALWADRMEARPEEKRKDLIGKDYKEIHDTDKSGTLSWDEQNNAISTYIKDYYMVPEGEKGMSINVGDETIENVAPEAFAFMSGFQHVRGRSKVDKAEAVAKAPGITKKANVQNSISEWLNLDAEFMKLSEEDQTSVLGAVVSGATASGLPAHLHDSYNQIVARDKLAVDIGKAGAGNRIQSLPDETFAPDWEDQSWLPTGDTAVPKKWVEAGLSKELYTNIRRMGAKAEVPRAAFEHIINKWDTLSENDRAAAVKKLINQYNLLIRR